VVENRDISDCDSMPFAAGFAAKDRMNRPFAPVPPIFKP
jgi:hypothetical protein